MDNLMMEKLRKLRQRLQHFDSSSNSSSSDDEDTTSTETVTHSKKIEKNLIGTTTPYAESCSNIELTSSCGPSTSSTMFERNNLNSISTNKRNDQKKVAETHLNTSSDDSAEDVEVAADETTSNTTSLMSIHRQRYALNRAKLQLTAPLTKNHLNKSLQAESAPDLHVASTSAIPSALSSSLPSVVVRGKRYFQFNILGKGGSSMVYQVYDEQLQQVLALKCVDLSDTDENVFIAYKNEILLLERLQSSNRVVKMYAHEYVEKEHRLYIVMEKGDTDLASFFKSRKESRLSDFTIGYFWSEMLKAVQVIHEMGIVHSDLKPGNFLLVAGHLKLIDFGIANAVPANKTSVTKECQMGTLNYMSPEAMSNAGGPSEYKFKVGVKSDVWSLGCILYYMVYGKTPFQHISNPVGKLIAITNPKYAIEYAAIDEPLLLDVMKKCLERDPKNRASIEQLLQHPYVLNKPIRATFSDTCKNLSEEKLSEVLKTIYKHTPKSGAKILKRALSQIKMDEPPQPRF